MQVTTMVWINSLCNSSKIIWVFLARRRSNEVLRSGFEKLFRQKFQFLKTIPVFADDQIVFIDH